MREKGRKQGPELEEIFALEKWPLLGSFAEKMYINELQRFAEFSETFYRSLYELYSYFQLFGSIIYNQKLNFS